jgi:hypothetical protein
MDANKIIQSGTLAKFVVNINAAGFDMETMDFQVILSWGMRGRTKLVSKQDMEKVDGGYMFDFDTTGVVGAVKSNCIYIYPDTDIEDGRRPCVDTQVLCYVTSSPCPPFLTCGTCDGDHVVTYTREDRSDVASDYTRLVDVNNNPIVTVNGEYIYLMNNLLNN